MAANNQVGGGVGGGGVSPGSRLVTGSNYALGRASPAHHQQQQRLITKQPLYSQSSQQMMLFNQNQAAAAAASSSGHRSRVVTDIGLNPDAAFQRISGITSEVFRQIEAVEAEFDPSQLAAQYAEMERRGEMIIRILSPAAMSPVWVEETCRRYGGAAGGSVLPSWVQFVEIIKRPGQTLGLYIREGDDAALMGVPSATDGVYISRIALESPVNCFDG